MVAPFLGFSGVSGFGQGCLTDVPEQSRNKHSCLLRTCPKHWNCRLFLPLSTTCRAMMFDVSETRRAVASHALCEHAQNTGIYSAFASFYSMRHKDV